VVASRVNPAIGYRNALQITCEPFASYKLTSFSSIFFSDV